MGQNKQAFTLVELIVVATILVVLATMGFAAFSDSIPDARDAERKAAIAQIESALSSYHAERQVLPLPSTNYFELSLWATPVAYQWKFDNTVRINNKLRNLPTDPYSETPYAYSITANKQEFQLSATLENGDLPIAYLQGDYMTVSYSRLPTIMIAANSSMDVSASPWRDLFVFNNLEYNLAYDLEDPDYAYSEGLVFDDIINDPNIIYWHKSDYRSCEEIKSAWKSIWNGKYEYLDENSVLKTYDCTDM